MEKKTVKKIVVAAVAVIVILIVASVGGGWYMVDYALRPKAPEKDFRASNLEGSWKYMFHKYPFLKQWTDSLRQAEALKDTFILADDQTRLHALYVASPDSTAHTAVIVHGYTDNAIRMMMIGYLYNHDLHYNILLPDLRYAGLSGGNSIQMGWKDRLDVIRWMEVANQRFGGNTQMVVHGISMGAATTMMVSGEKMPHYVKCFVEDCGYTSVKDQFTKELKEQFHLPSFPILDAASLLCQMRYGWNFSEASALNQVKKCTLPMFFIHGDKDDYVPTWMVYQLFWAKPGLKQLWVVPGAAHAMSYHDRRQEYTQRVREFTDLYINN